MSSVRALLTRVAKLEQARVASRRPVEPAYGSLDVFADSVDADICVGKLNAVDGPILLKAVRRWHGDGVWQGWERHRNGMWDCR